MLYLTLLSLFPFVWLLYKARNLSLNYRRAAALNLPIVWAPVSPDSQVWIAIQVGLRSIMKHVPLEASSLTRYCRLGWEFHDRYKTHERLGNAWVLVTPHRIWLYVAESGAAHEINSRSRDFKRPVWMQEPLNVFGPNIASVKLCLSACHLLLTRHAQAEGADWQRHRKLTATPFNEQKSGSVWAESLRQSVDMLDLWMTRGIDGVQTTSEDVRTLALHVIAYTGFKKSYPFKSVAKDADNHKPSNYRDSLSIILQNVVIIIALPSSVFSIPILPAKWKRIGWAITEFRQYMMNVIAEEKQLMADGKVGSDNLVSNLVRASEGNADSTDLSTGGQSRLNQPLSIDEILGNIFVYNFAGHDTTAISLAYSMLLLVAHPEIQDWIAEELQYFLVDERSTSWNYEDVFPKLKRSLAVLLETLRLYEPLLGTPKYTGPRSQTLSIESKIYTIPPDTLIVPNLMALQTHPRYWGDDSLVWRPQRWILPSRSPLGRPTQSEDLGVQLNGERLFTPIKGTYFPWSEGLRSCPGKRFAQVEFVAVMATLFRSHRVEPISRPGETLVQAQQRVLNVVKDSSVQLLLQMRDPDSVRVAWRRRD